MGEIKQANADPCPAKKVGLISLFDKPGDYTLSQIPENDDGNTFYAFNVPESLYTKSNYPVTVTYREATEDEKMGCAVPLNEKDYKFIYLTSVQVEWMNN